LLDGAIWPTSGKHDASGTSRTRSAGEDGAVPDACYRTIKLRSG